MPARNTNIAEFRKTQTYQLAMLYNRIGNIHLLLTDFDLSRQQHERLTKLLAETENEISNIFDMLTQTRVL
jgi:hypothetical protein